MKLYSQATATTSHESVNCRDTRKVVSGTRKALLRKQKNNVTASHESINFVIREE
jgi:hypothetical protein